MLVIPQQTDPFTSEKFPITQQMGPVTFTATGLSTGEEVTIQFSDDAGTTWEDLWLNGNKQVIKSVHKAASVYTPLVVRLVKPQTQNPVRVVAIVKEYTNGENL